MKINDELERLLATEQYRQQQARTVGNSGGEGFESLLTQQLAGGAANQVTAKTGTTPESLRALADPLRMANLSVTTLGGLTEADGADAVNADDELVASLTGGMDAALGDFDKYSASLRNSSLKDAWSALSAMDGNIAGLRQNMGRLSQPNAELNSMLNEIEVMAATEKFKFNRGDYF